MPQTHPNDWIPNINIGRDYDTRYLDATIHYDALDSLADFFGRDMSVHRHAQHLQIHFIEEGEINFHIDDKIYHVQGPSLFLTPATIPHSFKTSAGAAGHVLTINQSLVWQLLQNTPDCTLENQLSSGICITQQNLSDEQSRQWKLVKQLWQNIQQEWSGDYPEKNVALESYISLMLIHIARLDCNEERNSAVNNDDLRIYHIFTKFIEEHYHEHWNLPTYVDKIGVSESRLNQVCQRISNCPPKKIIRERLLQEIKRKLIFSRHSVNEVAYELGFTDPAYFSRFFKNQTGMSPLKFRKSQETN